jgi:methyl-accepting chemotaxis protein
VFLIDIEDAFRANLINAFLSTLLIGALIAAVMGMIMRTVKRSLGGEPAYAVEAVTRIAGGDLTVPLQVRADDHHSVLAAMQQMQQRLSATLGDIRGAAVRLPRRRTRSRPAITTCRSAPRNRRPRWSRPRPAWKS